MSLDMEATLSLFECFKERNLSKPPLLIKKLLFCFVLFLICSERDKTRVKEERVDPELNPLFYFSLLLSLFF